mgnify:FL=1
MASKAVKTTPIRTVTAPVFWCPACALARPILGRRMKHMRGLRTWVCKPCAEAKK